MDSKRGRDRRRSKGEDDEDELKGPSKPIKIPSNDDALSSEEESEFSVPESPNEKTLREVMARSPWTASPSPNNGAHIQHEDHHRGRNNSFTDTRRDEKRKR